MAELVDLPAGVLIAMVAELVYARDSKSRPARVVGSSPTHGTITLLARQEPLHPPLAGTPDTTARRR